MFIHVSVDIVMVHVLLFELNTLLPSSGERCASHDDIFDCRGSKRSGSKRIHGACLV